MFFQSKASNRKKKIDIRQHKLPHLSILSPGRRSLILCPLSLLDRIFPNIASTAALVALILSVTASHPSLSPKYKVTQREESELGH